MVKSALLSNIFLLKTQTKLYKQWEQVFRRIPVS